MRLAWLGSREPMLGEKTIQAQPASFDWFRQASSARREQPPHTFVCKVVSNAAMRRLSKASDGGLAQLGEHLLCKQGVVGSIPTSSTILEWGVEGGSGSREGIGCLWV